MEELKTYIRDVPDFPKPGIIFKDITPLLHHAPAFQKVVASLVERYQNKDFRYIVAIESRGFIFGTALAHALGKGFIPVRKKGKLPWKTVCFTYELEYGTDTVEMHEDAICLGDRVLVIDDLLATGGTSEATCQLIEKVGGVVVECAFVVELEFLNGRKKLNHREIFSLIKY